jgi:hypothetical protein
MARRSRFVNEETITFVKIIVPTEDFDLDTGEYAETTEEEGTFLGNIQPITGKMLERLPEGRRSRAKNSLWAHDPVEVGTIIKYKGSRYEVEEVDDWNQSSSTIPHFKYVLLREDDHGHDVEGEN